MGRCTEAFVLQILVACLVKARAEIRGPYGIQMCKRDCCSLKGCDCSQFLMKNLTCLLDVDKNPARCIPITCRKNINACTVGQTQVRGHRGSCVCLWKGVKDSTKGQTLVTTTRTTAKPKYTSWKTITLSLPLTCEMNAWFRYRHLRFKAESVQPGCFLKNEKVMANRALTKKLEKSPLPSICGAVANYLFMNTLKYLAIKIRLLNDSAANTNAVIVQLGFCTTGRVYDDDNLVDNDACFGFVLLKEAVTGNMTFSTIRQRKDDKIFISSVMMRRVWNLGVMVPTLSGTITLVDVDTAVFYAKCRNVVFKRSRSLLVQIGRRIAMETSFYDPTESEMEKLRSALKSWLCKYEPNFLKR